MRIGSPLRKSMMQKYCAIPHAVRMNWPPACNCTKNKDKVRF